MDDSRIRELTAEVLAQLAAPKDPVAGDLEARVAALERALVSPSSAPAPVATRQVVALALHASQHLLDVPGGSSDGRCILEPNRPCVQSGQCRSLGH